MRRSTRLLCSGACIAGVLSLGACGAGLITGIAASNRGGNSPEARVPELSVQPLMPLVPAPNTTRTAVVANVQIAAAALIRVRIEAAGVAVDQLDPTASGQGGSTAITFTLETGPIVAAVGDATAADVPGQLSVLVDEKAIAPAVPIQLARQPRAVLVVEPGASERFLSPLGERVAFRVAGLRSTESTDLQVLVTTPDPEAAQVPGQPAPVVTRAASDVRREPEDGGEPMVSAFMPGNTFPVQCELLVIDAIAGQSTTVLNAYYRPDVALALPSQGPTTGGTLLTLIGTALVPYDFGAGSGPAPFDFDAVQLSFEKGEGSGERVTQLDPVDFRTAESGSDRLVFVMPPSPDGRPGQVDIVLRVELGAVTSQVVASQVFQFANPDPFFGPRGVVFDRTPVAVATIGLDQAPSTAAAPDFAALTEQGGVAFVQLLLAQQNGMFQPFAAPRQIGNHEVAAERDPRDMCVGDFNGDQVPDLFIANAGAATAVHHVVRGQAAPAAPLGPEYRFAAAGGSWICRSAFFDGDALPDVLLVPGPTASPGQLPQVLLARPSPPPPLGYGEPGFAAPIDVPVRTFPYEAVEVADLDGDGVRDIAVVSGTQGKLDVAFGVGDGTFLVADVEQVDFTVPGYTPAIDSPAVGLHAGADGTLQSLCLVLAGKLNSPLTQPTVTALRQTALRDYAQLATDTFSPPTDPIGRSLAADIDQQSSLELVIAMRGVPLAISLGLVQFSSAGYSLIGSSIEGGIGVSAESPRDIRALVFDRAFPATGTSPEKGAVFIVHETEIDGVIERRLSTRLVFQTGTGQPGLLPPDATDQLTFRIENLISGNFLVSAASGGAASDLAAAQLASSGATDAVLLVENDGFGGVATLGNQVDFPGLLADSLAVLPSPAGQVDVLLFVARDSRVASWLHDETGDPVQTPDAVTSQLRALVPALATTDLAEGTRTKLADVDGDGVLDLVVLMSFALANPQEGQAAVALLRGRVGAAPNEFPFWFPTAVTPVHGRTSAIALGDFVNAGPGQPRLLELAAAVPAAVPPGLDTDHVRFFRYVPGPTPADDRFEPSAVATGPQVLLAGSSPIELTAADFDRDGTFDLLVACRGDSSLRLFRNTAGADPLATQVDVEAFAEALGSPWLLASGLPTQLQLSDVNGDENVDAIVFVEFTSTVTLQRSTTVAMYLSSGDGSFDGPRFVSPTRIGNRNARLSGDLGDWNRDGVPDLCLGWDTLPPPNLNLRILSGGTR